MEVAVCAGLGVWVSASQTGGGAGNGGVWVDALLVGGVGGGGG